MLLSFRSFSGTIGGKVYVILRLSVSQDYFRRIFILDCSLFLQQLQGEAKIAALVDALGVNTNFALTLLDNILHNSQA